MNITISIADITNGNGTERAVTNLANILTKFGKHEVTVISIFSSENSSPYFELDASVRIVHLGQNLKSIFSRQKAYRVMNKTILSLRTDGVNNIAIGTDYGNNISICKLPVTIKKVCCAHMNYESITGYAYYLRKFFYKRADAVVLLTNADASHYSFIKPEKKFVIPNSLSFISDKISDVSSKKIICVGRLKDQKGFDILIQNANELKNKIPDWEINIFGSGEEKDNLLDLIEKNNLADFIKIHEPVKNIQNEFLDSSIYLMTSRYEGLPMVLLEAKTCGLPIVSFDCPEGPADVINNNEDGFLVPLYDTNALFEKVERLANDEKLRKNFSVKAKENSKEFSSENVFRKWKALLEKITEEKD